MRGVSVGVGIVVSTIVSVASVGRVEAAPLRRNLSSYAIFGQDSVRLNSQFQLATKSCNIGVNCAGGVLNAADKLSMADGDQLVADVTNLSCPADIFELFANGGSATPAPGATCTVRGPVKTAQPFTTPILAPNTCPGGVPNPDALAAACGFPMPFPACGATPLLVQAAKDCAPYDTKLGNGQCDLPPGVYGAITIKDDAKLVLAGGTYVACSFIANKQTTVTATMPATIQVTGELQLSNGSVIGTRCGELDFMVNGTTDVQFGKSASIIADVCAPRAGLRLGHSNHLQGHFVGDEVSMDRNNMVECCEEPVTCTCFDQFVPTSGQVGSSVKLTGNCDLTMATGVTFECGGISYPAVTTSVTATALDVTVPAIPANSTCQIVVRSTAGRFVHDQTFTVLP